MSTGRNEAPALVDDSTGRSGLNRAQLLVVWIVGGLLVLTGLYFATDAVLRQVADAGRHYADRNAAFAERLTERGLPTAAGDGLNLWVELPVEARLVAERLMRRGWLARTGDEFQLAEHPAPSHHLRLTVHDLDADETARLLDDLAEAALANRPPGR